MNSIDDATGVCPICGFDVEMYNVKKNELRLNFILMSRYMIGKVVAESDNEITYIGWDLVVDCRVLIKEYYPKGLVKRNKADEGRVNLVDYGTEGIFSDRKRSYKKVSFDMKNLGNNSGMIKVVDIFEDNNTVYQVILCPTGHTISDILPKYDGMIPASYVGKIATKVVKNLCIMHKNGILCDAINVKNILVTNEYEIEMLDYNTASNFLKYNSAGVKSDVYDVCASAYIMLVDRFLTKGQRMELRERIARVDDVRKPSEFGVNISSDFEEVILKGLGFEYNSAKELYKSISSIKQFEDSNNPNIAQKKNLVMINENKMCNVQEGRQDMMRDDMNKRNQLQTGYGNRGRNIGANNNTGARLNTALRSGGYGQSSGGYQNVDNVETIYEDANETRHSSNDNKVVSLRNDSMAINTSRNISAYPIQDEWRDNSSSRRVQGSYSGVDDSTSNLYSNVANKPQASNRPQRPGVSLNDYPMSYNASRASINQGVNNNSFISDNEELKNINNNANYNTMPIESPKKSGKKAFFSVVACSLLVGLSVFMVSKTMMASDNDNSKAKVEDSANKNKNTNQATNSDEAQEGSKATLSDGTEYLVKVVSIKSRVIGDIVQAKFKEKGKNVDLNNLTTVDLSIFEELSLDGQSIDTLEDLSYFPGLKKVSLNGCNLTNDNVDSIKGIQNLQEIDLSNNERLNRIDSLAKCEKLEKVYLGNTGVTKQAADIINQGRSSTVAFNFGE